MTRRDIKNDPHLVQLDGELGMSEGFKFPLDFITASTPNIPENEDYLFCNQRNSCALTVNFSFNYST